MDEQRAEDSGSGESETDSSSDPDSEDSGSAAFAQRVHPAEQFRAERGEAEHVDTVRSGQCTPRAAMWLKNAASPLNPPPKSMLKGSIFFFRLSARSSNTHQRGLIWSAILTTLNFREKTRLQSGDTLFYLLEKTSKSCIFTHGAPPCSEQSCNKAMFSRHPRATRGIASRISPPFPPKSMLSSAAAAPSRPSNIDLGGRGVKQDGEATEMPTALQ